MNFQDEFPVLANTTYINTAASGTLSESLLRWRREHDNLFLQSGSAFRLEQAAFLEGVKDTLAAFFKADRKHTFLVSNFSSGFNTFLDGLDSRHRFLLLENEFPAVYYPVQSRGFACNYVAMGPELEERIIENIKRHKPAVFAFSLVQYTNGVKLDQAFIHHIKGLFPELILVADGTQYCGTELLDFSSSSMDVLIASGYKWMLGGYGNGFVFLKEPVAAHLYAEAKSRPLPEESFLQHKSMLHMRFEPGHQDTLNFGSLQQSVLFLDRTGYPFITDNITLLAEQAKIAFSERGLLDDFISKRPVHSSIFRLNIEDDLVQKIQDANITGTARGKGLRVSFHFYNNLQDLEQLLQVVDRGR